MRALVMELVEGPTLEDRLSARQLPISVPPAAVGRAGRDSGGPARLPIDESLSIAKQIAEALDAAHSKNIERPTTGQHLVIRLLVSPLQFAYREGSRHLAQSRRKSIQPRRTLR